MVESAQVGLTFAELAGERWVLPPPETVIGSVAQEAFRAYALGYPKTSVVATPLEVRMRLLATGNFLTILPASALRLPTGRPEIKALPVQLPIARVPNGIVTMTNRALTPVARSLPAGSGRHYGGLSVLDTLPGRPHRTVMRRVRRILSSRLPAPDQPARSGRPGTPCSRSKAPTSRAGKACGQSQGHQEKAGGTDGTPRCLRRALRA